MNGNEIWVWFVTGLIPYYIERKAEADGRRVLILTALFWSFAAHSHYDKDHHWTLRIPLIERLRNAAWIVVAQLQKETPPQA